MHGQRQTLHFWRRSKLRFIEDPPRPYPTKAMHATPRIRQITRHQRRSAWRPSAASVWYSKSDNGKANAVNKGEVIERREPTCQHMLNKPTHPRLNVATTCNNHMRKHVNKIVDMKKDTTGMLNMHPDRHDGRLMLNN